jgi:protein-S-isoprenylcysteine O-methyltransferase Ste14
MPFNVKVIAMTALEKNAYGRLLPFMIAVAGVLFAAAWTIDYWQAWAFLLVFFGSSLAITAYLAKHDPGLLERRLAAGPSAEKEQSQKVIQVLAMVAFIAIFVFPAIDHRYGWSSVPASVTVVGDILIAIGFFAVFLVFKENSYASSIIEVGAEQKVVTTGPYAVVRHPMYSGALVMLVGVPLALGSWWGLLLVIPITLVLVWRLLEEETFLTKNLVGYPEYQDKVRYHLLPFVW